MKKDQGHVQQDQSLKDLLEKRFNVCVFIVTFYTTTGIISFVAADKTSFLSGSLVPLASGLLFAFLYIIFYAYSLANFYQMTQGKFFVMRSLFEYSNIYTLFFVITLFVSVILHAAGAEEINIWYYSMGTSIFAAIYFLFTSYETRIKLNIKILKWRIARIKQKVNKISYQQKADKKTLDSVAKDIDAAYSQNAVRAAGKRLKKAKKTSSRRENSTNRLEKKNNKLDLRVQRTEQLFRRLENQEIGDYL